MIRVLLPEGIPTEKVLTQIDNRVMQGLTWISRFEAELTCGLGAIEIPEVLCHLNCSWFDGRRKVPLPEKGVNQLRAGHGDGAYPAAACLVEQRGGAFFLDKTTFRSAVRKTLGQITQKTHIDLTTGSRFWQQWAELLLRWSGSDRKSKIKNQK